MKMMECWEIIDKYISGLRKGFHCVPGDKRLRIITPYLYPDNDLIEVFIEDLGSGVLKLQTLGKYSDICILRDWTSTHLLRKNSLPIL